MTRIISPGFLRPLPHTVRSSRWEVLDSGGTWLELSPAVEMWDYATSLTFRRSFEVDADDIRRSCELPATTPLGISVTWRATGTNRRGAFTNAEILDGRATVVATLSGEELGGQLHLKTAVIPLHDIPGAGALSPRRAGSILWSDAVSTRLEGESSMFPTEEIDFATSGLAPATAAWYLEWNPSEPDAAALGSVRLFINSAHHRVRRAASSPDRDETSSAITSTLLYDVFRQLIEGALDSEDFDDSLVYPQGSVGAMMKGVLRMGFGSDSTDTVRALRRISRADFEAKIQATAGLFSR